MAAKCEGGGVSLLEDTQSFIFLWTPGHPSHPALRTVSSGTGQEVGAQGTATSVGGRATAPLHQFASLPQPG